MKVTLITDEVRAELSASPFKILKEINLSGLAANLNIIDIGGDGGMFLSSKYKTRDIEIEGAIITHQQSKEWIKAKRECLFKLCNPKKMVRIEFEDDDELFYIEAYPVAFPTFGTGMDAKNAKYQTFLLQFTAADPFLYKQKKIITFANVMPSFSFPMSFNSVTMGEKSESLIRSIYNDGVMECPIEMTIEAFQEVVNPYLLNIYTQEKITLNTTMIAGDKIIVNTGTKKEVSRYRNGIKEVFFSGLSLESNFILLAKGDNVFRFGADSGEDALRVSIAYTERLGGI